jgi:hypothetical protein
MTETELSHAQKVAAAHSAAKSADAKGEPSLDLWRAYARIKSESINKALSDEDRGSE